MANPIFAYTILANFMPGIPIPCNVCLSPVVQSIVSLPSLLSGHLVKCFMTSLPNTLIFFVEKMREACSAKVSHIFSTKNIGVYTDIFCCKKCKSFSHIFKKYTGIFEILTFEILTTR